MDDGIYRDRNGDTAWVKRTASGYVIRYADGRVISVSTEQVNTGTSVPQFAA